MYQYKQFNGEALPEKTLCLTYDDGPGADTLEIASFLHSQHIRAAFFVVGKYAYHQPGLLQAIKDMGHIIGNHTYDHPDLPYYDSVNGNVQDQVIRTDTLIRKYAPDETLYFRAPYGKWSKEVADNLNSNILTSVNYVGPIHWDIEGIDCYYWRQDFTIQQAVEKYLSNIQKERRGIIVMHDDISDMDYVKAKNQTLALTKALIPLLKEQGYRFVGLDEIEDIKAQANQPVVFNLISPSNKTISLAADTEYSLNNNGRANTPLSSFYLIQKGYGKVALKASNGLFLNSYQPEVLATSTEIGEFELFDWIPVSGNNFMLRSQNGNYLTSGKKPGSPLMATAEYMRQAHEFTFKPTGFLLKDKRTFNDRLTLIKKRFLFIKSKLANP